MKNKGRYQLAKDVELFRIQDSSDSASGGSASAAFGLLGGVPTRLFKLSRAGFEVVQHSITKQSASASPSLVKHLYQSGVLISAGLQEKQRDLARQAIRQGRVGVVYPVFRSGDCAYTKRVCDSEELTGLKVVVVDDASAAAVELPESITHVDALLIRHNKNQGPAASRNIGWRHLVEGPSAEPACSASTQGPACSGSSPNTAYGNEIRDHESEQRRSSCVEIVVFIDDDVEATAASIIDLSARCLESGNGLVAPRITALPNQENLPSLPNSTTARSSLKQRLSMAIFNHETKHGALDMGEGSSLIAYGGPVAYVPSAMVAINAKALVELDGFDESLRVGEDVDFCWRAQQAMKEGELFELQAMPYCPNIEVGHRVRPTIKSFCKQRFGYGYSAGLLAKKHAQNIAPVRLKPLQGLAAFCLLAATLITRPKQLLSKGFFGKSSAIVGPSLALSGIAIAIRETEAGTQKLTQIGLPNNTARRLSQQHSKTAFGWLANAIASVWAPVILVVFSASKRPLRAIATIAIAALAAMSFDSSRRKSKVPSSELKTQLKPKASPTPGYQPTSSSAPLLQPAWRPVPNKAQRSSLLVFMLDKLAYGAGVWWGCIKNGELKPLMPSFGR